MPGVESGKGGAAASVGAVQNHSLTVDFHESGFLNSVQREHSLILEKGFWSRTRSVSGPMNPQALNRYAYVLNNPIRYIDPSGHDVDGGIEERRTAQHNAPVGSPSSGGGGGADDGGDCPGQTITGECIPGANDYVDGYDGSLAGPIGPLPFLGGTTKDKNGGVAKNPSPGKRGLTRASSPAWKSLQKQKGFKHHKGDIYTNGKSGRDRRYYRWDVNEEHVELYDHNGRHLGNYDPVTGKQISGRQPDHDFRP